VLTKRLKYLYNINKVGRGIIVMHDDTADRDDIKQKNKTFELTKILIPILKSQGFRFIRLDEIDNIKNQVKTELQCYLQGRNKKYLLLNEETAYVSATGKVSDPESILKLIKLKNEKVAIKTANDLFLSCKPDTQEILSSASEINNYSSFDLIPVESNQIILRAATGYYLRIDKRSGNLMGDGHYLNNAEIFTFSILSNDKKNKIFFKSILKKLKKIKFKIVNKYYP